MKYKTVQIRPDVGNTAWVVKFYASDKTDRKKGRGCYPHPLGFFHYWETISDDAAFKILKNCLIKNHQDEITRLQKSLAALQALEMPILRYKSPKKKKGQPKKLSAKTVKETKADV